MSKRASNVLVIVPAGGKAREHYVRTVERLWTLDEILRLGVTLPDRVVEALREAKAFAIWGATPSTRGVEDFFARLEEADSRVAAFYREGRIVCWGRIIAWLRSRELAEKLWGRDERGQTWEYVYFVGDLRCCEPGIPWDDARRELGYSGEFVPRGHTFVRPERLNEVAKRYGDILRFFDTLAEEKGACRSYNSGVGSAKPGALAQRYNPYLIQSLKRLKPIELLEVIGRVAVKLEEKMDKTLSKNEVVDLVTEALREAGLERHINYLANVQYPLLLNDLRRLGLITAGDPLREWGRGVDARVGPLSLRVTDAVKACFNSSCGEQGEGLCFRLGGAVAVISILAGIVPAGSPGLQQVLEEIAGRPVSEVAEDLAKKLGVAGQEALQSILVRMKDTIAVSIELVKEAWERNCLPLLYLPLGLANQGAEGGGA